MIALKINDIQYNIKNKLTVIQACLVNKVDVPRFCFHEKLSIAGNCRMCLVEDVKQVKPLASCAISAGPAMNLYTNTIKVKKARESVLEFLLANHPLDCPICDQGGECDLQDQSVVFGSDRGRFYEFKRSVEDKDCGPLIKTIMNRCIHCTRCVRFSNEIAGNTTLGVTGRGSRMEIGFYIEKLISSELSGNVIDLCPVGALTSKPFSFTSRPWELKSFNTIDILDSMHSNIRVDVRGTKIMRILPRINENINDEWITDKIRFSYDGFRNQRLYNPMILKNNRFVKVSWQKTMYFLKNLFLKNIQISNFRSLPVFAYLNNLSDIETTFITKKFLSLIGGGFFKKSVNFDCSSLYFANTQIKEIQLSDICLLVGTNLRIQLPLLNSKIRNAATKFSLPVYYLGHYSNYNFYVKQISNNTNTILSILEGSHWMSVKLSKAFSKKPLFLFSSHIDLSLCFPVFEKYTNILTENWIGINLTSSIQNIAELGMSACNNQNLIVDNFAVDFLINYDKISKSSNKLKIYIGHHGDSCASRCDIILPSTSFIEKEAHYLNVFGTVQKTKKILFSPGTSKVDWQIINAIIEILNISKVDQKYTSTLSLLQKISNYTPLLFCKKKNIFNDSFKSLGIFYFYNIKSRINNYHLSNIISKNSRIMSLCSNRFKSKLYNFVD